MDLALVLVACVTAAVGAQRTVPAADSATQANITRVTARILGQSQFSHHSLDDAMASRFLEGYIDALDRVQAVIDEPATAVECGPHLRSQRVEEELDRLPVDV